MEPILGAILAAFLVGTLLLFRWIVESNRKTVEMMAQSNEEIANRLTQTIESTYAHLKEASPIGGLPRDLWLEQHELRKRELGLREKQLNIETPLRQEALRAKLMKAHKLNSGGRVTNPEG
tara:strand:- start:4733 stop:5095 length:363 start_codon:yes stop_codon:yes gene_type:complete